MHSQQLASEAAAFSVLAYLAVAYPEIFNLSPILSSCQSLVKQMQICSSEWNHQDGSMRHLYAEGHPEMDDCIGKGQSGGGNN